MELLLRTCSYGAEPSSCPNRSSRFVVHIPYAVLLNLLLNLDTEYTALVRKVVICSKLFGTPKYKIYSSPTLTAQSYKLRYRIAPSSSKHYQSPSQQSVVTASILYPKSIQRQIPRDVVYQHASALLREKNFPAIRRFLVQRYGQLFVRARVGKTPGRG